jgi:hypothetical protein
VPHHKIVETSQIDSPNNKKKPLEYS